MYDRWFQMLEEGASYAEVADRLNEMRVPTGRFCRGDRWDGKMVGRITSNPMLKGLRIRNRKMSKRVNSTGRRISIDAPREELLERECPHLAFIDPDRYDRVIAGLKERNQKYRRSPDRQSDPRRGVPRKRTRWPGQSVHCGVCGRLYVYGGHGQKDRLMCSGAHQYQCWNVATFDGPLAAKQISRAIHRELEDFPEFGSELTDVVHGQLERLRSNRETDLASIESESRDINLRLRRVLDAIQAVGVSAALTSELSLLERRRSACDDRRRQVEQRPTSELVLPSADEIAEAARLGIDSLASDSQEFARCMRRLAPTIYVFPFRLIDGGNPVLRAQAELTVTDFLDRHVAELPGVSAHFSRTISIDLFEPPQRERFRRQIEETYQTEEPTPKERDIAARLGITQPAVQRAKKLTRLMAKRSLTDPYVRIDAAPANVIKWKRHEHPRYAFSPLDGFPMAWQSQ